jgi:hypothetical protein
MGTRRVIEHLESEAHIARFTLQAERLLRIQRQFDAVLPPRLRRQARVANLRAGKLLIHVANAAAAAKIRQLLPRLTQDFLGGTANVTEIEVRVQANLPAPETAPHQPPPLPSAARQAELASLQQGLPVDSPLANSLARLLKAMRER